MAKRNRKKEASDGTRCGVYLRVSTEMQVDRNSLSTQKSSMLGYAEAHGWNVVKVFTDAGLSAKDTRRPAFQEMLKWAKDGRLDIILVSKIDRISRNMMDLLGLIDDLNEWGVDFVSASQSFDTSTPMGTLILNMLGSFAQFEREMTADRVRENMRERAKKGTWSGGQTPFGYRLNRETKFLEIEPDEAPTIRTIFDTYLDGHSIRNTVHTLNAARLFKRDGKPWGTTSMRRLLANPVYIGTIRYGKRKVRGSRIVKQDESDWIVIENACEPIIDAKQFRRAQEILGGNGRATSWKETSPHLLGGLVRCGICGGKMYGLTSRGKKKHHRSHRYYRCVARLQKGKGVCEGLSYRADELEEAVIGQIVGFDRQTLTQELEAWKAHASTTAAPLEQRRQRLRKEYEDLRGRERRVLELYEEAAIDVPAFKTRRQELEERKVAVARELAEIESNTPGCAEINPQALAREFGNIQETFPYLSQTEKKQLLSLMIQSLVAHPDGHVEIDFNLVAGLDSEALPLNEHREIELDDGRERSTKSA